MQSSKGSGFKFGLVLGIVGVLLIGIYFLFGGNNEDYTERVTGTVISSEHSTYWTTEETTADEYRITVEFTVDGETYRYNSTERTNAYNEGDTFELAYIPGDPEHAISASGAENAFVLAIVGGIIAIIGILIIILSLRGKKQQTPDNT